MTLQITQERFERDPWHVIVVSLFAKRTQVSKNIELLNRFFEKFPKPNPNMHERLEEMKELIQPAGFKNKRSQEIMGVNELLLKSPSPTAEELSRVKGVGEYIEQAYKLVCLNDFSFIPKDEALKRYWEENRR